MRKRLSLLMAIASMVIMLFALDPDVASANHPHGDKGIKAAGCGMEHDKGVLDLAGAADPALDNADGSNPLQPGHYDDNPPWPC